MNKTHISLLVSFCCSLHSDRLQNKHGHDALLWIEGVENDNRQVNVSMSARWWHNCNLRERNKMCTQNRHVKKRGWQNSNKQHKNPIDGTTMTKLCVCVSVVVVACFVVKLPQYWKWVRENDAKTICESIDTRYGSVCGKGGTANAKGFKRKKGNYRGHGFGGNLCGLHNFLLIYIVNWMFVVMR